VVRCVGYATSLEDCGRMTLDSKTVAKLLADAESCELSSGLTSPLEMVCSHPPSARPKKFTYRVLHYFSQFILLIPTEAQPNHPLRLLLLLPYHLIKERPKEECMCVASRDALLTPLIICSRSFQCIHLSLDVYHYNSKVITAICLFLETRVCVLLH
jgi:hypothetical protein